MTRFAYVFAVFGLFGCGGSSSETPWPREPDDVDLGPAGERETEDAPFAAGERSGEAAPATIADPNDPAAAPRR
jgi:hypothetical protein